MAPYLQYGTNPVSMTQAQWGIMCVIGVASILGVFLPLALPILPLVGGRLPFRTNRLGRQIGITFLIIGAMLALALIARAQYALDGLGRWIDLVLGIVCLATAFSSAQR